MEIFKKEWGSKDDPDGTIIDATVLEDGSLKINGTDYGASARGFSGGDDYEYGLHIKAEDVPIFAVELLKRSFTLRGQLTFSKVKKVCKNAGIQIDEWYY